jgi:hypothetical protein
MGVDAHIYLPADVRVRDVAEVMGVLAGLPFSKRHHSNSKSWGVEVKGAEAIPCAHVPTMCTINLTSPKGKRFVDGEEVHFCYYHFEPSGMKPGQSARLLTIRSTPFWLAIGVELVKFFGGRIDFNDSDTKSTDFRRSYPKIPNNIEDGRKWQAFQEKIFNTKPITRKDMQRMRHHAAYPEAGFETT